MYLLTNKIEKKSQKYGGRRRMIMLKQNKITATMSLRALDTKNKYLSKQTFCMKHVLTNTYQR